MREANISIPLSNRASAGITTALYDRRALDCTSTLPLISSLGHLAYLTASSARIRDILVVDGGIERLISLLKDGKSSNPCESWLWNLAFQCLVNVGVRGSENVRKRIIEADAVPVVATVLHNYILSSNPEPFSSLHPDSASHLGELVQVDDRIPDVVPSLTLTIPSQDPRADRTSPSRHLHQRDFRANAATNVARPMEEPTSSASQTMFSASEESLCEEPQDRNPAIYEESGPDDLLSPGVDDRIGISATDLFPAESVMVHEDDSFSQHDQMADSNADASTPSLLTDEARMTPSAQSHRFASTNPKVEDVLMSLQLLAYISKYSALRLFFQNSHLVPKLRKDLESSIESRLVLHQSMNEPNEDEFLLPNDLNVFSIVERFTTSSYSAEIQHWAGVVMRNLCRKDDDKGGIRQCAHHCCGSWEAVPRQFAKCRRCRRTKYCSKDCQKKAWSYHRYWCSAIPT